MAGLGPWADRRGVLRPDTVGTPLPFVVRAAEADASQVAFELDATAAARLKAMLERLEAPPTPTPAEPLNTP